MFIPTADAVVAHRYRLVEEIGRGGMGSVWKAIDVELDAPCALKFILDQQTKPKHVRSRFLREARAAARLQSPHVVSVRSVGEWDEALYITMELLSGETLAQRLKRTRTLTPKETLVVVRQVALVLAVAHGVGIVHRDLKPENIWLWSGAELFVKVLDFGVAKHLHTNGGLTNTNSGALVGTPYYMSPEQAAGDRDVDHRVDLWALAVIAIQCLSGRLPFRSAGLGQLLSDIINRRSPPLSELYPASTGALDAWWQRATAADPNARYTSAQSLAFNLALALELEAAPSLSPKSTSMGRLSDSAPGTAGTPDPNSKSVVTQEADLGFDAWRNPTTKTTSGQPVTSDVLAIPFTGFVNARQIKTVIALASIAVAGAAWMFTPRGRSPETQPLTVAEILPASASPIVLPPDGAVASSHAAAPTAESPGPPRVTSHPVASRLPPRVVSRPVQVATPASTLSEPSEETAVRVDPRIGF